MDYLVMQRLNVLSSNFSIFYINNIRRKRIMTDEELFTFNRVRRKASYNPHFHVFCISIGSMKPKTPFFNASISSTYFQKMKFLLNSEDRRKIIRLLFIPLILGMSFLSNEKCQTFQTPLSTSIFIKPITRFK